MKKIEKLTEKQEQDLKDTLAHWLDIGRGTQRLNRPKVKEIVTEFYRRIEEPEPMIFFFDSPMTCILGYAVLKELSEKNKESSLGSSLWSSLWSSLESSLGSSLESSLGSSLESSLESSLRSYFGGNHWCAWEVFYDFCNKIGAPYKKEDRKLLDIWLDQSQEMHWWFPYKGIVLASERPTICKVNAQGRLHNESDMAIKYADGWGIYSLNGVTMKEGHVMTPASKLDSSLILKETNVEVRRELIRKVGVERLVDQLPHKILDKQGDYSLISLDLAEEMKDCRYLKMLNPSIGVWHMEGVARECSTVQEAINWRAGDIKSNWNPLQLT